MGDPDFLVAKIIESSDFRDFYPLNSSVVELLHAIAKVFPRLELKQKVLGYSWTDLCASKSYIHLSTSLELNLRNIPQPPSTIDEPCSDLALRFLERARRPIDNENAELFASRMSLFRHFDLVLQFHRDGLNCSTYVASMTRHLSAEESSLDEANEYSLFGIVEPNSSEQCQLLLNLLAQFLIGTHFVAISSSSVSELLATIFDGFGTLVKLYSGQEDTFPRRSKTVLLQLCAAMLRIGTNKVDRLYQMMNAESSPKISGVRLLVEEFISSVCGSIELLLSEWKGKTTATMESRKNQLYQVLHRTQGKLKGIGRAAEKLSDTAEIGDVDSRSNEENEDGFFDEQSFGAAGDWGRAPDGESSGSSCLNLQSTLLVRQ